MREAAWQPRLRQFMAIKGDTRVDVFLGGPTNEDENAAKDLAAVILQRIR